MKSDSLLRNPTSFYLCANFQGFVSVTLTWLVDLEGV